jgi:hypothetical protein
LRKASIEFEEKKSILIEGTDAAASDIKQLMEQDMSWEELPLSEKMKFFNFWFVCSIVGNCFQLVGSVSILLSSAYVFSEKTLTVDNVFIGFGCFFAWFQTFYYLEFSRNIVLITTTLKKSYTLNLVYFGLVIPIFIGFALLGQAFFWGYEKFENTGASARSLFALLCGDIVYNSFTDTINESYLKQLFLFVYVITFYTAMSNIFVAIVMEGYERTLIRKELDNDDPFPDLEKIRFESASSQSDLDDPHTKGGSSRNPDRRKTPGLSGFARFKQSPDKKDEGSQDEQMVFVVEPEHVPYDYKPSFRRSLSFEQLNEERTPKQECVIKLRDLTQKIKEKLLDMKLLVQNPGEIPLNPEDQDFVDDIFHQYLEDLCGKIDFLVSAPSHR